MNARWMGITLAASLIGTTTIAAAPADNAALLYWQAWFIIDNNESGPLDEIDAKALATPEWTAPEGAADAIKPLRQTLDLLGHAADKPECDFATRIEDGPAALLPHLSVARKSLRLLLLDARLRLDEGDAEGFTDRIVTAMAMTHDVDDGSTVIAALVGLAMFKATEPLVDYGLETGALDIADRTRIAGAIAEFDSADPFHVRGSLLMERDVMADWMRRRLFHPDIVRELRKAGPDIDREHLSKPAREAIETIDALFDFDDEPGSRRFVDLVLSDADIETEISLYEDFFTLVEATFDQRDAAVELRKLEDMIGSGEFGTIATVMVPAVGRMHHHYWESRDLFIAAKERWSE